MKYVLQATWKHFNLLKKPQSLFQYLYDCLLTKHDQMEAGLPKYTLRIEDRVLWLERAVQCVRECDVQVTDQVLR